MSRVSVKLKPIRIRCITVGDSFVGKTCLLIRECKQLFPEVYVPTQFESYVHEIILDSTVVEVQTEDARGEQEDYARLRPLCYFRANMFIICFDLSNPTSYENVSKLWYPEIHEHCPDVPFILVGTKLDLREDEDGNLKKTDDGTKFITYEQGQEMKSKVGALDYFECSSLTGRGVNDVFYEATCHGVSHKLEEKKRTKHCVVI
ncbi:ras-related C3 botulinum toxin substrate 1-like [Antedon mediterranea]|uniref:ras-related C3 botulinum toxin substrate 1-like n=1 Tax=Antedon mediterranea TaxID=105859 RepID=UPI003AF7CEDA